MKKHPKKILLALLFCSIHFITNAQVPPLLNISKDSPTSVQINWTNIVGTSYRVLFTSNLTNHVASWTPVEDAFSADTNVSVSVSRTTAPNGFFSVEIPTNGITPAVQIFSPTNNQTVSGEIAIGVGAQITNQLLGVNLYLDGSPIGFVDSGGIAFSLDTTHFANGLHTLYVSAVDTGNNETPSSSITLDFENSVRWLDADSLFQSFVPIDVQSDIFPATWAVFVSNTNGAIIRTFSGSTSDGNISTNWDGNDNNGVYAPDQAAYNISVVVTSSGSGDVMMLSSSSAKSSSPSVVSASPNRFGVMEYEIAVPVPDPMAAYSNLLHQYLQMPVSDRIVFPPFADLTNESGAPIIETFSAYDMFMLQHPTSNSGLSGQTMLASPDSNGGSGSTGTPVWREAAWNSGEIVLARQKLTGLTGVLFDGTVANLFENVNDLVSLAGINGHDTYQNSVLLMQHNGDFGSVNTALSSSNPNTRAFFFWGHGSPSGNAIGFEDGTPSDGIKAKDLGVLLGNSYAPYRNGQPLTIITTKPFDMVFLDGCMTGLGSFPEAFGIPKISSDVSFNDYHKHKRAFMGWGGRITLGILDTESLNWSLAFWNSWLGNPTDQGIKPAIDDAFGQHPSGGDGAPMLLYGSQSLTWAE